MPIHRESASGTDRDEAVVVWQGPMGKHNRQHGNVAPGGDMKRREVDLERDYESLLEMQRSSWTINFPRYGFHEEAFLVSLRTGVRRGETYVYEEDGEMVGWLWLDTTSSAVSGHIRHIQVVDAHWGRGVGRRIMEDAIALCRAAGMRSLTLNVTKSNERAMRLYAGLGFTIMDQNQDRQRMRLHLDDTTNDTPGDARRFGAPGKDETQRNGDRHL
jgi:ribosomal protein S18 acetylase RimI-like enzyme